MLDSVTRKKRHGSRVWLGLFSGPKPLQNERQNALKSSNRFAERKKRLHRWLHFFLYNNLVNKNVEAEINQNNKTY